MAVGSRSMSSSAAIGGGSRSAGLVVRPPPAQRAAVQGGVEGEAVQLGEDSEGAAVSQASAEGRLGGVEAAAVQLGDACEGAKVTQAAAEGRLVGVECEAVQLGVNGDSEGAEVQLAAADGRLGSKECEAVQPGVNGCTGAAVAQAAADDRLGCREFEDVQVGGDVDLESAEVTLAAAGGRLGSVAAEAGQLGVNDCTGAEVAQEAADGNLLGSKECEDVQVGGDVDFERAEVTLAAADGGLRSGAAAAGQEEAEFRAALKLLDAFWWTVDSSMARIRLQDGLGKDFCIAFLSAEAARRRQDWHCALVGLDEAIGERLARVARSGRRHSAADAETRHNVEMQQSAGGGWQAVVRWPALQLCSVGPSAPSKSIARREAKRWAVERFVAAFARACTLGCDPLSRVGGGQPRIADDASSELVLAPGWVRLRRSVEP